MKTSLLLLSSVAILAFGCAAPTSDVAPDDAVESEEAEIRAARKISSDPKLAAALDALHDVASGGASLEFFGWNDSPRAPSRGCKSATPAEVVSAFDEIVDMVMESGDTGEAPQLTPAAIADTKARFAKLVGKGSYKICDTSTSGGRSIGNVTTIVGARGGLRVAFELGWED